MLSSFRTCEPIAKAENKKGSSFPIHRSVIDIDIRIRRGSNRVLPWRCLAEGIVLLPGERG